MSIFCTNRRLFAAANFIKFVLVNLRQTKYKNTEFAPITRHTAGKFIMHTHTHACAYIHTHTHTHIHNDQATITTTIVLNEIQIIKRFLGVVDDFNLRFLQRLELKLRSSVM